MKKVGGLVIEMSAVSIAGLQNLRLQAAAPPHVHCDAQAEKIEELWRKVRRRMSGTCER